MKKPAAFYIAAIIASGFGVLIYELFTWQPESLPRLLIFTLVTVLGSLMKVRLPGITGTMSVYFLFLLVGLTQLSLPEILIVGFCAVVLQCFWHAKQRPKAIQVMFNVGSTCVAIHYAYLVFHWKALAVPDLGPPIQIAAASLVFFLFNTGLVAGVVALTEEKVIYRIWYECYFWCFPYYLMGAALAGGFHYLSEAIGWQAAVMLLPVVYVVYGSYRLYLDKLEGEKEHVQQVAALHLRTIEALALAIDAKDHSTHAHLRRVQTYAMEMGRELGLKPEELSALEAASLLHDIGKLAVPENIISKPGKLTPEEFEKMKIHPIIGAEILETVQFPYPVAPVVRAHHEKWDGSGYPFGLKGEEIPVGARILAVVDCLDAMASDRPYRRAMPLPDAVAHIESESGKSFDPKLVALLKARYQVYESKMLETVQEPSRARLSHDVHVERGEAPDAGFETSAVTLAPSKDGSTDFLSSIASARHEVQTLFELVQSLGESLSLRDTLSMLSSRLGTLIEFDALAVFLLHDGVLKPEYVIGVDSRFLGSLEIPVGQGLSGWVAENKSPIINGAPAVEGCYKNGANAFCSLSSALAVPLIRQDAAIGVLALYSLERDHFNRDELRILQAIAAKLAMSVENARRFEQAQSSATIDFLTGLPNARSLFLRLDEEISRCNRMQQPLAVVVCDLDNFKQVNDRFGHMAGNDLLRSFAAEGQSRLRRYDYMARMGGDEFVILLPNLPASSVSAKAADLNHIVTNACVQICGEKIVSMSYGVALLGEDGDRAEDLLCVADRRMYENKEGTRQARSLLRLVAQESTNRFQRVN
jgi:diguanylate cyclase (GGDEF)-like protein/putative nucleotidyltransferase with HDIG domain